jgi:hypothetical protein
MSVDKSRDVEWDQTWPGMSLLPDVGDDRENLVGYPDHTTTSTNGAYVTNPTASLNPPQEIECTGLGYAQRCLHVADGDKRVRHQEFDHF